MSRRSFKAKLSYWLISAVLIGVPLLVIAGYLGLKHYENSSFVQEGQACVHAHGQYVCKQDYCNCFKE